MAALLAVGLALATVLATAVAQRGGNVGGGPGEGASGGVEGPPLSRPPVDAAAGAPAFLVSFERGSPRLGLLDGRGRVARLLPATPSDLQAVCPGGRVYVTGQDFGGVEVRSLTGELRWRRALPPAGFDDLACLDARGRRVAVVLGSDVRKSLRIVSRTRDRRVRRARGVVSLLTSTRLWVNDGGSLTVYRVPSGQIARRLEVPARTGFVAPSADGRLVAGLVTDLTAAGDLADQLVVVDARDGQVGTLPYDGGFLVGWLSPTELAAVRAGRVEVFAQDLREVTATDRLGQVDGAVRVGGRVVAVAGSTLLEVRPGARRPARLGAVPRGTRLLAALAPGVPAP